MITPTRRPRLLALVIATALVLAACGTDDLNSGIRGSGNLVRQTVDVTDFDQLDIGAGFEVTVTNGSPSAVIEVDDNLLDKVVATNRDGLLRITLEGGVSVRNATLRATITMFTLAEVRLSGAARAEFAEPVRTPTDLEIDLAGASRLDGAFTAETIAAVISGASRLKGLLSARTAELRLTGASTVSLSGLLETLDARLSGASTAELRDLETRLASLDLSGASNLEITVTERISRLNLTGASEVDYFGGAVIDSQTVTGASRVNAR